MPAPTTTDTHSYDKIPRDQIPLLLRRHLPAEVRKLKAFVVFKFRPPKKPGGKRAKLPFYVVDGTMRHGEQASKEDRTRLVPFPDAVKLFEADRKWAGIGICALEDNPVFFVDIDNCFDAKNQPNEVAAELLHWNTYTEYSPSGRGLRMVFSGNLGVNRKRHSVGLELFCTSGFVTLTGLRYDKQHHTPQKLTPRQTARLAELLDAPLTQADEDDLTSIPSPLDKARLKDVERALKLMDPDCGYEDWLRVGQALHSGDSDPQGLGFQKWLEWSQEGGKFEQTSEQEMLRKWRGFKAGKGITLNTLFGMAKDYGFDPKEEPPKKELPPDKKVKDAFTKDVDTVSEKELSPLAEGLFDHHGAYMFIGRAKIGKSRILGALVSGALTGSEALGFKFNKKCKVLALTLEEDPSALLNRVRAYTVEPTEYKGKFKLLDEEMVKTSLEKYGEDYDWAQWLEIVIRKVKPDFVYVDTPVKLRMMWGKDPEYRTKNVTEQDYHNASAIDEIAQRYGCVIVAVIHGSKRKSTQHGFDPFESIGTTSWTLGGCTGAIVLMDKPGYNPMEEAEDGQKVLSVRGRYMQGDDKHFLMQSNPNGTFTNVGPYHQIQAQTTLEMCLRTMHERKVNEGVDHMTAREIGTLVGKSDRTVRLCLHNAIVDGVQYEGLKLVASQGTGYALVQEGHGPLRRTKKGDENSQEKSSKSTSKTAKKHESAPDQDLARARARRAAARGEFDPLS